tara:strand:- start:2356 stop:3600 length:1245 start_codon:yes stop_codon:yes gene_type:complete
MIFAQDYEKKIVTVVDSGSTDATKKIVKEFRDVCLVEVVDFLPGKAINIGIKAHRSKYAMILSAHCLIKGSCCISSYVNFLEANPHIAGAYGRQLPLKHTHPDDARDLILTFGNELRIQRKDSFFHNANSMLRVSLLDQFPIDNEVKHIEDRLWADHVIKGGYAVAYLPQAEVYHYHGLHQHGKNSSFRAEGVVSLLRTLSGEFEEEHFEKIHGRECICPVVILVDPVVGEMDSTYYRVKQVLSDLNENHIYLFADDFKYRTLCRAENTTFLFRSELGVTDQESFRVLSRKLLDSVENNLGMVVDGLNFIDMSYTHLNLEFVKLTRRLLFDRFYKAVLPAWQDFGNYWKRDGGSFVGLNINYEKKEDKSELFRSVLGQGGCVRSSEIRSRKDSWTIDELVCTYDINVVRRIHRD